MPTISLQQVKELVKSLCEKHWKVSTAESCTGGGLAYWLTMLPGSSAWFERGFVTYSNNAKIEMLGVHPETLRVFGPISTQTATQMAEGALHNSNADFAIAITCLAGPSNTTTLPIGTVFIGYAGKAIATEVQTLSLAGDRHTIREETIHQALAGAIRVLKSEHDSNS